MFSSALPSTTTLAHHLSGRDNNLNLLRMVAASMVLVSHSYAISQGSAAAEPWRATFGATPGSIAVEIFFLISGMLLTWSLVSRRSIGAFVQARALRIYPGLIVAMLLTVFVLGPVMTTLDLSAYFGDKQTWRHLIKNMLAVPHAEFILPGVFGTNPLGQAVNGSIWTLRSEIFAYLILLGLWATSVVFKRGQIFKPLCLALFAGLFAWRLTQLGREALEESHVRLFWAFFTGSALCMVAKHIPLKASLFAVAVAALVAGVVWPKLFPWAYTLAMPYVVIWLAYVPAGACRAYNRLGDYSYGTYIYAFPIQQWLAACVPGIGVPAMVAGSFALTLGAAVLSWHGIEKRASKWRVLPPRLTQPNLPALA